MAYNLIITKDAEQDLDSIHDYNLNRFLAPQAAENTMSNIKLSIAKPLEIPDLGINISDRLVRPFSSAHELKMLIVGNYLVFYIVDLLSIVILRVIYQNRNWIELFKE